MYSERIQLPLHRERTYGKNRRTTVKNLLKPVSEANPAQSRVRETRLIKALQQRYGDKYDFFLDDDLDESLRRRATLPAIRALSQVALLPEIESFPEVEQREDLTSVIRRFRDTGGSVYGFALEDGRVKPPETITEPNLVVLSGHKDSAFQSYVRNLQARGALRNRVVLLFSCYADSDEAFNSDILAREGAPKAVIFFTKEVSPVAVKYALFFLSEILKDNPDIEARNLRKLLIDSIDRAVKSPRVHPENRDAIMELRDAIMQLSLHQSTPSSHAARGLVA